MAEDAFTQLYQAHFPGLHGSQVTAQQLCKSIDAARAPLRIRHAAPEVLERTPPLILGRFHGFKEVQSSTTCSLPP